MPKPDPRSTMLGVIFAELSDFFERSAETVTRADLKRAVQTIKQDIRSMNQELQTIIGGFRAEVAETRDAITAIKLVMTRKDDAYRAALAAAEAKGASPEQLQEARDVLANFDQTNADLAAATLENTAAEPPADTEPEVSVEPEPEAPTA